MLRFFKKHQKLVFWIITVVIVVTFSFFGSYNVMSDHATNKDTIVTHSLDGKEIKQSEIQQMRYLIEYDHDTQVIAQGKIINLFNPGVLMNDIIKPGIASYLLEKNFPILQKHFETNFARMQKANFYEHPRLSMVSSKSIWMDQAPMLYQHLQELQSMNKGDVKACLMALKLFQDQLQFPPFYLAKTLYYLQNQLSAYTGLQDPELAQTDFSLFGYHSFSEWFGEDFMDLISEFIIQVAHKAESEKITVTDAEVKLALENNFKKGLEKFKLNAKDHPQFFDNGYQYQLSLLHIPEPILIKTWKQVLLFEKYFKAHDTAVIQDNFTLKNYTQFAQEKVEADLYYLPQELHFKNIKDLASFQVYLLSVAKDFNKTSLELPKKFLSANELNKKHPELVEQEYTVEMSKLSLNDLMLAIGEKDLWKWQLEDKNFVLLQKEFPFLATQETTPEKRFEVLQKLSTDDRIALDQACRKKMVLQDENKILEKLNHQKMEKTSLVFFDNGNLSSLSEIQNPIKLKNLLDQNKNNSCVYYNDNDQMVYYSFKLIQKSPMQVISYKKACDLQIMDNLVDNHFKEKIAALQAQDDQKKTQADQEKIYLTIFEPFLADIKKVCEQDKIGYKKNLLAYRFYPYMKNCLKDKKQLTENVPYSLQKETIVVTRDYSDKAIKDAIFSKNDKNQVLYTQKGLAFYEIKNRAVIEEAVQEKNAKMHQALYEEICSYLGKQIIDELNAKHLLNLPSKA
jgi:hypothetical protein